jgi:hypothetical protein
VEFLNTGTKTDLDVSGFTFTDYVHFFAICTNTYVEHFLTDHLGGTSASNTQASIEFEVENPAAVTAAAGTRDGSLRHGDGFRHTGRWRKSHRFVGIGDVLAW